MSRGNARAFPVLVQIGDKVHNYEGGMTIREHLAAIIFAQSVDLTQAQGSAAQVKDWAKRAVCAADALLEAVALNAKGLSG